MLFRDTIQELLEDAIQTNKQYRFSEYWKGRIDSYQNILNVIDIGIEEGIRIDKSIGDSIRVNMNGVN